ncbi:MAG: ferritin [Candidatus Latescibacterota bacterium]
MISEKIQKAMNEQINAEFYSAYLYLSMAAFFESQNLGGFANWMRVQTQEELAHGTIIFNYLNQRGGIVKLTAIEAPPTVWASPLEVFEKAYAHEQKVTGLINRLVDVALSESDHASNIFLQWFVTEQVEEELNTSTIAHELKIAGDNSNSLFMIDRELAARVFTPPPALVQAKGV